MRILLTLTIALFSFDLFAAQCVEMGWLGENSKGREVQQIFYDPPESAEECPQSPDSFNVLISSEDYLNIVTGGDTDSVVISNEQYSEYQTLKEAQTPYDQIINTLKELFEFSTEDFAQFTGICLAAFIVGHSLGRVVRLFGKT